MASTERDIPRLVYADAQGNIYDHPELAMVCRSGADLVLPRPDALMPLPEGSELFLLPGRRAVGLDEESGQIEVLEESAVAAFISPAHTLAGTAAYLSETDAPTLPLFAYGAVGFLHDRFWVAAKRVDQDLRQVFSTIPPRRIEQGAHRLLREHPKNRLMAHLATCALTYGCPAAKNLALGRFEAPLPTSRGCNARCIGCISCQPEDSGYPATQARIAFRPTPEEIAEVMTVHSGHERTRPVLSFGQGCEGEPLTEAPLLAQAIRRYRDAGGTGTVNVNTNASMPDAVAQVAEATMNSMRVSLNSAHPERYARYYRPQGYDFDQVRQSIATAKDAGMWVSLNLLYFPGFSDTEAELVATADLVASHRVDYVQMRNLNLDPELYAALMDLGSDTAATTLGPAMGLTNFMRRLRKTCPWLEFGYFNPYLQDGRKVPFPQPQSGGTGGGRRGRPRR